MTGGKLIRYDLGSGAGTTIAIVNHVYDLAPDGEHLVIPFFDASAKAMTLRVITKDGHNVRELVRLRPDERVSSSRGLPMASGSTSHEAQQSGWRSIALRRLEDAIRHRAADRTGPTSSCIQTARNRVS